MMGLRACAAYTQAKNISFSPIYFSWKLISQLFGVNMNNSTISEVFNIISKSNVNQDFFHGVFESTNMKFFILGTYGFGTLGILGLLLITHFERSGNAGQFRTLVNQLVSFNLDQVCKSMPSKINCIK